MNELTKNLACIQIRSGVEIWIEQDRLEKIKAVLTSAAPSKFLTFEDRVINTADIVGIFTARDLQDSVRRRNGGWQCPQGGWHGKGEKCDCVSREAKERNDRYEKAVRECGKCRNGLVEAGGNAMRQCACVAGI